MEITFQSVARANGRKSRGNGKVVYDMHNHKPIVFNGGIYRTTDKEEVQRLMHSRIYKDNTIELVTDLELVNDYLMGNEPDKLTADLLKQIDGDGLRKIAKIVGIPEKRHGNMEGVLRTMLKGTPITSMVYEVMKSHSLEEPEEDIMEKAMDAELIYRSGPWYKYRKGKEQQKDQDLSLGRTEEEVQKWIAQNKDKLKERLN